MQEESFRVGFTFQGRHKYGGVPDVSSGTEKATLWYNRDGNWGKGEAEGGEDGDWERGGWEQGRNDRGGESSDLAGKEFDGKQESGDGGGSPLGGSSSGAVTWEGCSCEGGGEEGGDVGEGGAAEADSPPEKVSCQLLSVSNSPCHDVLHQVGNNGEDVRQGWMQLHKNHWGYLLLSCGVQPQIMEHSKAEP